MLATELHSAFLQLLRRCPRWHHLFDATAPDLPSCAATPSCIICSYSVEFCREFIRPDGPVSPEIGHQAGLISQNDTKELPRLTGIPIRPFSLHFFQRLEQWLQTGLCPIQSFPLAKDFGFDSPEIADVNFSRHQQAIQNSITLLRYQPVPPGVQSEPDLSGNVSNFMSRLTCEDILFLMGLRHTTGSIRAFPPDRMTLLTSFHRCHKESSDVESLKKSNRQTILSVGARALSKHALRSSECFWGMVRGSEAEKNEHARCIIESILDNAVWMNVHTLPHSYHTFEVRTKEGYGARWTSDGMSFRGFLEPQHPDGHALRWRH
eukprot:TRINITY_DN19609_c0_g1::TRINITY_DN19609_c0_g1_i1::g.24506::m.24506 TRINITY_DN19609_c0_g1::TRINITY_DN19609_c0_g1_i1::g.24506  ORF type:complete len:321 (+),score=-37.81 TRINITY_DN19609_c0_g1_i1:116-1078(+)